MKIVEMKVADLIPYANNPRNNADAVDMVAASIKEFGFKVPIVVDKDNVIVAGHTRLLASKKLKLKTVPCVVADDLTPAQIKAFRLADNKAAEQAEWDEEKLAIELQDLDIDMLQFGFETGGGEEIDNPYTTKIQTPQYEPTGESVKLSDLYNTQKYDDLISEIENTGISKEDKEFLKLAATRHIVFDYAKIAEYYANAPKEVQELMERSALVIIDYQDAIKNGYVDLKVDITEMVEEQNG